jgi:hypothetical protein
MPPAALPGAKLLKSLTNGYGKGAFFVVPQTHLSRFLKSGPPEGPPEAKIEILPGNEEMGHGAPCPYAMTVNEWCMSHTLAFRSR